MYIEIPGRHILFGTLIHDPVDYEPPFYLRMFNGVGYTSGAHGLDYIASRNLEVIRAFIPLAGGSTLVAILEHYNREPQILRYTTLFFRDRAFNNTLYAGILNYGQGQHPHWLNH